MSDTNAHDNTYNGSSSEATVSRLMNWPKTLCFKISEKPSQKHKTRARASLSLPLSLSLSFYDLSKFANGLDPEDCWYAGYIHIPQERIFNPCIRTCSMFCSKLKWIFKMSTDICYLSHATKAQASLRKFVFSIQRDTHPSQHTKSSYHRPSSEMPFKWRFAVGLVVALFW